MYINRIIMILVLAITIFAVSSCSVRGASSLYEQGVEAFNDGNYQSAEKYFDSAINKGYDKKNINELYNIVTNYNSAAECLKNGNYKDAEKFVSEIPKVYEEYHIKGDIKEIKETIKEYDKANEEYNRIVSLYNSGLYDAAENIISDINVKYLTGTSRSKLTEIEKGIGKKKNSAAEDKSDIKIPEEDINRLMQEYAWGLVDAINNNDFSLVSDTLYNGSSLYSTQKNLVEKLYSEGTKEEMISLNVKSIVKTSDTTYTITTYESAKIIFADGTEKIKYYDWKYTAKIQDGKLRLTGISKN